MIAGSRTEAVMDFVRGRINSGQLPDGARLPSIRRTATNLKVSPSTVVDAFDRLVAEGAICSRPGSGFYVIKAHPALALAAAPGKNRAVDPFWVSRQSLDAADLSIKPGCGWLPAEWMAQDELRKAMRKMARSDNGLLVDYGTTKGAPDLRNYLSRRFSDESLLISSEQLLLTPSGTQAIDLICRYFLQPGDAVLVDEPCYFNFRALLRAHQVTAIGVPFTPDGPDLAAFGDAASGANVRLYITNSGIHNPTGATLAPHKAHRVLALAAEHDLIIIEDDIFAAFEPEPSTRYASLDSLDRVLRIGSFSKSVSAALRCGYIAAKPEWIEALTDLQLACNFGGPSPVAAQILFSVLSDGGFHKHMAKLLRRLASERQKVAAELSALGIQPWIMPRGGFYLWCRLPEHVDSTALARAALDQNIVLAPGNVFSVTESQSGFMRVNVSQTGGTKLYNFLRSHCLK